MSEPIRPALTSEEWRSGLIILTPGRRPADKPGDYDGPCGFEVYMKPHADPSENMLWAFDSSWAVTLPSGRRHALAALCLHGQPYGFTWEDVEWLRIVAEGQGLRESEEIVNSIADRIAALLPPEDA